MKQHHFNHGQIVINRADCFDFIQTLADNSIDLVCIDPPYYQCKADSWDNQWDSVAHYLAWLDDLFYEIWRVLKPNGSFYCFCSPQLSAETEMLIKARFNVLNHIVWAKPSGHFKRAKIEIQRHYFSQTERIIFAEHYGGEGRHKGQVGLSIKCEELKQQTFKPLADYFINAKNALSITNKAIQELTGSYMGRHWFSYSQWALPNEQSYELLQSYFEKIATEKGVSNPLRRPFNQVLNDDQSLKAQYNSISEQYSELKKQYEILRRPFLVSKEVPYTDVWTFPVVQHYEGKHPCEKPQALLKHIINTSSRPGDVVADFFMGSGSTAVACVDLDRKFIGCEFDKTYYDHIVNKLMMKGKKRAKALGLK